MEHLRPLIQELSNINELKEYVNTHKGDLRELVLRYVNSLGKSLGFVSMESTPLLRYSTQIGKIDCVWRDNDTIIAGISICFGSKDELLANIWRLIELSPSLSVLIISSKSSSGFQFNSLVSLLKYSKLTVNSPPFLLLDITGKSELIIKPKRRRKVIVGHRPKAQD